MEKENLSSRAQLSCDVSANRCARSGGKINFELFFFFHPRSLACSSSPSSSDSSRAPNELRSKKVRVDGTLWVDRSKNVFSEKGKQ
jgi:hypothetical protein